MPLSFYLGQLDAHLTEILLNVLNCPSCRRCCLDHDVASAGLCLLARQEWGAALAFVHCRAVDTALLTVGG